MAAFKLSLSLTVGFALCSLAASSESCSVATGACDSLDQADGMHVSLLQADIEHKASAESTKSEVTWVGPCHGGGCPNASTVDHRCPTECQAFYGTAGLCMGRDEDNKTCPETFDLENGEFCPQGCIVTVVNVSSSLLSMPKQDRKVALMKAAIVQHRGKSGSKPKQTPTLPKHNSAEVRKSAMLQGKVYQGRVKSGSTKDAKVQSTKAQP
jgi:hypothetical protein